VSDHLIPAFGKQLTVAQWAATPYAKASAELIQSRLNAGWPAEKAIRTTGDMKLKGVSWHIGREKYIAQIKVDGKVVFCGAFDDAESAARAYDKVAGPLGRITNF
jgi:hypothetical protein